MPSKMRYLVVLVCNEFANFFSKLSRCHKFSEKQIYQKKKLYSLLNLCFTYISTKNVIFKIIQVNPLCMIFTEARYYTKAGLC